MLILSLTIFRLLWDAQGFNRGRREMNVKKLVMTNNIGFYYRITKPYLLSKSGLVAHEN